RGDVLSFYNKSATLGTGTRADNDSGAFGSGSTMSVPYASFCDDFYVNMRLGSQMQLPNQRETVLHFFERLQRDFPGMTRFRRSDNGELSLEEDRGSNAYRWATIEAKRLSSGHVNPPSIEESVRLHQLMLQMAPHYLGISSVEIDYL